MLLRAEQHTQRFAVTASYRHYVPHSPTAIAWAKHLLYFDDKSSRTSSDTAST
ncbi:TPA: hypothetical protein U1W61_000165 [Streptococcus suis]|nr:hypothetical protein [Streptococcus suis]HEM4128495.1 hypothetical protein [Streptococcus suis]